jgi:hypothetical protein
MKSVNRSVVVALGLGFVCAIACAQNISTIGGNLVLERGGADTGFGPFYLLDTNHPFTSSGPVDRWEIFADATNPVQLVIYRHTGGAFQEVGRSEVMTPTLGYNLFKLDNPIHVQAGDFVGAFLPTLGAISNTDYLGPCPSTLNRTVLFSTTTSTGFGFSCQRTYSLRAFH